MTLDLTNAFCGDTPDRTNISELGLTSVDKPVAATSAVAGTTGQRGKHALQSRVLFSVQAYLAWSWHRLTCDQITQSRVATLLDGRIKADMVAAIAHQIQYALRL